MYGTLTGSGLEVIPRLYSAFAKSEATSFAAMLEVLTMKYREYALPRSSFSLVFMACSKTMRKALRKSWMCTWESREMRFEKCSAILEKRTYEGPSISSFAGVHGLLTSLVHLES